MRSKKYSKKYYTPQFSELAAVSVRRLAWSINKTMLFTVNAMVQLLPHIVDPAKVCSACKDKSKCSSCVFGNLTTPLDPAALEAII